MIYRKCCSCVCHFGHPRPAGPLQTRPLIAALHLGKSEVSTCVGFRYQHLNPQKSSRTKRAHRSNLCMRAHYMPDFRVRNDQEWPKRESGKQLICTGKNRWRHANILSFLSAAQCCSKSLMVASFFVSFRSIGCFTAIGPMWLVRISTYMNGWFCCGKYRSPMDRMVAISFSPKINPSTNELLQQKKSSLWPTNTRTGNQPNLDFWCSDLTNLWWMMKGHSPRCWGKKPMPWVWNHLADAGTVKLKTTRKQPSSFHFNQRNDTFHPSSRFSQQIFSENNCCICNLPGDLSRELFIS